MFDTYMAGPSCWPVKMRRAFLLTLPVSALLYFVSIALIMLGALAFMFVALIPFYASKAAVQWIISMWRAP